MFNLKAEKREKKENLKEGFIAAVLYGEGVESAPISVNKKDFLKVFKAAGETSLIDLELSSKKYSVLVHDLSHDAVSDEIIHIDFFSPSTKKKVEAEIPLIFEGIAGAVKEFGGILVKEFHELKVKGLARDLPHEIKVNLETLKTLDDRILVGDLVVPGGIEVLREKEEIVALVTEPKPEKEEPVKEGVGEVVEGETGQESAEADGTAGG